MFSHKIKIQQNNNQSLTLFKGKNDYNKVMKEMNEPPKEYEAIKLLVEENNNSITNIQQNNINKKSKNNINLKSHNKLKNKK